MATLEWALPVHPHDPCWLLFGIGLLGFRFLYGRLILYQNLVVVFDGGVSST